MNSETPELQSKPLEQTQKQLLDIIDNPNISDGLLKINFTSETVEDLSNGQSGYAFLGLAEPIFKGKRILDLFCGRNPIKQYVKQNNLDSVVIGIDNAGSSADIKADVAHLSDILPLTEKFDIITAFGAPVPNCEDYESESEHLDDNGLYIIGMSTQYFMNVFEQLLNCDSDNVGQDYAKLFEYFRPVVQLNITLEVLTPTSDSIEPQKMKGHTTYILFRKS